MLVSAGVFGGPTMTVTDRIEINPKVMMGKPVIRGTRIPVELILRKLSEGATEGDLLDAHPRLKREDIQAAIGYAADTLAHEETVLGNGGRSKFRRPASLSLGIPRTKHHWRMRKQCWWRSRGGGPGGSDALPSG